MKLINLSIPIASSVRDFNAIFRRLASTSRNMLMACFYHYRRAKALACLDVADWSLDLDLDFADAFP